MQEGNSGSDIYKASQLSGKILASGASGLGSIPGEAFNILERKGRQYKEKKKKRYIRLCS